MNNDFSKCANVYTIEYENFYIFIMQLKKEIAEVTQDRGHAQSQVKDLLRVLGDDKQSVVLVSIVK